MTQRISTLLRYVLNYVLIVSIELYFHRNSIVCLLFSRIAHHKKKATHLSLTTAHHSRTAPCLVGPSTPGNDADAPTPPSPSSRKEELHYLAPIPIFIVDQSGDEKEEKSGIRI